MSRSNNTELTHPSSRFFEWDGTRGGFKYYEKPKVENEKGRNVPVPYPFKFIVLDTLHTVRGFDDAEQSGYWSNEVRDIKKDELTVRNKKGICATGLYESVIRDKNTKGSKYCQAVYIGYMEGIEMKIGVIRFVGAALSAWIDFRKKNKVFEIAISVTGHSNAKKGTTDYTIPIMKAVPVSKETDDAAKYLDIELQKYFNDYFKVSKQKMTEEAPSAEEEHFVPDEIVDSAPANKGVSHLDDDLPF